MKRLFAIIAAALIMAGCSTTDYAKGVQANVDTYKLFSDGQLSQQASIQACFQFNPNKSECSILAAGTNATQTLAGQPAPIRIAKTNGEIFESVATVGMDKAVLIYGAKAVAGAFRSSQAANQAASAANAQTAAAGIEAASKPPLVVDKPVIVQVPAGSSVVPTE
ncbi:hypothetical protein [Pseudomonas sp.]|uniref:hypothetical protein n=1 Tax=Pseudomonas sp. TaxID=306 RepID=UPI00258DF8B1|nr:hypothetical protein [Pseudomonas sp.]